MIGIMLTLLAVLATLTFAFYAGPKRRHDDYHWRNPAPRSVEHIRIPSNKDRKHAG